VPFGAIVRRGVCLDDDDWRDNAKLATAIDSRSDALLQAKRMTDCIKLSRRFDCILCTEMDVSRVSILSANDLD
jgi:hypothetical protein